MQQTIENRNKLNTAKILLGVVFLMCGCFIYLLFRSKTLYIYLWCKTIGLSQFIDTLRYMVNDWSLNDFIKYCLPDGLYCAAYILIIDASWHDANRLIKYIILSVVPFITITSEVMQYFGFVQGTFDFKDLLCYTIPPLVYTVILFINLFKYNFLKAKRL